MQTYYWNDGTELYHYGVKGQRWGERRYQNEDGSLTDEGRKHYGVGERREAIRGAKANIKRARGAYKEANRNMSNVPFGLGVNAIRRAQEAEKANTKARNKAERELWKAQAELGKVKRGEKGEFNAYKRMFRPAGLPGSVMDASKGGQSSRLYDTIARTKGKDYAESVLRSYEKESTRALIGSSIAALGSYALAIYLSYKD